MHFLLIFIAIFINIYTPSKGYSSSLPKDFYLNTNGDLILNQPKKTINTNKGFFLKNNKYNYSAEDITIWYQDLDNLDLEHINRIESNNNIKIQTNNNATIKADRYIYSLSNQVHTLIADKNPVTYQDPLYNLTAQDRIEYFIQKNVVVIRGNPIVNGKNNNQVTSFKFSAKLINIQLVDNEDKTHINNNLDKDIVFVEALEKVTFIEGDTTIKSNYAIYYKKENQIEFYDKVTFINKESKLYGDAAIYNFNLGYGSLISSSPKKSIKGTFKPVNKKNEQK